jgi:hypothetical protein
MSTRQDAIDILAAGATIASRSIKPSSTIVNYIQKAGLRKVFKGMEGDNVGPYSFRITLPSLKYEHLTPLIEFLYLVMRFIDYTKYCT